MKIYFETYGCAYNFADTNYMKSLLKDHNISDLKKAEVIILNTCAVKDKTVNNFRRKLKEIKKKNPKAKVILAGCLTQASAKSIFEIEEMKEYSMIGPNNLKDIEKIITSKKKEIKLNDKGKDKRLKLKSSKVIEIIPISKGCLNDCTYCQTKLARGKLVSFPIKDIIERISNAVKGGTKIIYLTSQDNGCYGFNIGTNLSKLLEEIVKIEGDFKVRIGMANPQYTKKIIKPLIKIMKNKKIFKFLHIPIQSGSDKVLKDMKRGHNKKDLKEIISYARKEIPNITIATDIIVGYPTETKKDFDETISLLKVIKFDIVNRSKFSSRPGTKAFKLKPIQTNEVTRRSKILDKIVKEISEFNNSKWKGWEGEVIVESAKRKGSCVARNDYYKPIVIKKNLKPGNTTKIKITGNTIFHLNVTTI